jgi:hypothetical protein
MPREPIFHQCRADFFDECRPIVDLGGDMGGLHACKSLCGVDGFNTEHVHDEYGVDVTCKRCRARMELLTRAD